MSEESIIIAGVEITKSSHPKFYAYAKADKENANKRVILYAHEKMGVPQGEVFEPRKVIDAIEKDESNK